MKSSNIDKHDEDDSIIKKDQIFNLDMSSINLVDQSNFLTNLSISEKGEAENFDLSEIVEETENSFSNSILNNAFLDDEITTKLSTEKNSNSPNFFEKAFLDLLNNCEYFKSKEVKCKIDIFLNRFMNEDKENNLANINIAANKLCKLNFFFIHLLIFKYF